jgi:hypothetical protein
MDRSSGWFASLVVCRCGVDVDWGVSKICSAQVEISLVPPPPGRTCRVLDCEKTDKGSKRNRRIKFFIGIKFD